MNTSGESNSSSISNIQQSNEATNSDLKFVDSKNKLSLNQPGMRNLYQQSNFNQQKSPQPYQHFVQSPLVFNQQKSPFLNQQSSPHFSHQQSPAQQQQIFNSQRQQSPQTQFVNQESPQQVFNQPSPQAIGFPKHKQQQMYDQNQMIKSRQIQQHQAFNQQHNNIQKHQQQMYQTSYPQQQHISIQQLAQQQQMQNRMQEQQIASQQIPQQQHIVSQQHIAQQHLHPQSQQQPKTQQQMSSQQQIASQQQLPRQPAVRQQNMQMPAPSTPHLNQHFVTRLSRDNDSNGDETESIDSNSSKLVNNSPKSARSQLATQKRNISLINLMQSGALKAGVGVFTIEYLGHKIVGDLLENAKISYKTENGVVTYDSPSTWATFVKKGINPQKKSGCGWNSVKYNGVKLDKFKLQYLAENEGINPNPINKSKIKKPKGELKQMTSQVISNQATPQPTWLSAEALLRKTTEEVKELAHPNILLELQQLIQLDRGIPSMLKQLSPEGQQFTVEISSAVLAVIKFHTCSSNKYEMNGYLGGSWDEKSKKLRISEVFPCKCVNDDDENKQKNVENEIEHEMKSKNLLNVGWYHSHINSSSNPTLEDLELQSQLQKYYKHPYLMIINAPFNNQEEENKGEIMRVMHQMA